MHTVLQGGIFLSLTKQWEVEEVFAFPLELGGVKEGKKINVQVNWEAKELMGVIHVRGIYHVTAKVRFGLEKQAQSSIGTLIEHIDLEGDEGYFEYAIPFNWELPNGQLKDLRVEDIKTTCRDSLHIAWQVICVYDELTTTTDEVTPENYLGIPKIDVKEQIMEEMKVQAKMHEMVEQKVKEQVKQMVEPIVEQKVAPKKEQHAEMKKEVSVQPVQEVLEQLIQESTKDESSHETRNDYVNESINRILEDDHTEFIFQLEDTYRKQSVPLNKIRQQQVSDQ